MIDAGEFDYVIAGGGTAGCVVAARPAINPCITTMMIGEKCAEMIKEDARAGAEAFPPPAAV